MRYVLTVSLFFILAACAGCQSLKSGGLSDNQSYPVTLQEAEWIQNGEPIEFEASQWAPTDNIEVFTDSEMRLLGSYRSVQFFAAKEDVKPYQVLYTKFDRNQFRAFTKKEEKK